MQCKDGYRGPLCAVCAKGYFRQLRDCVPCKEPKIVASECATPCRNISLTHSLILPRPVVAFGLGSAAVVAMLVFLAYKLKRYLDFTSVFAFVKILISFSTVVMTVDSQVGCLSTRCIVH
jgi:hypothetical protein